MNQILWDNMFETGRRSQYRKISREDKIGRGGTHATERVLHCVVMRTRLCLIDRVTHVAVELTSHVEMLRFHIVLLEVDLVFTTPI